MSTTQPARGMRDFLPDEVRRRDYVVGVIRRVYERYGFDPIETPALENIETLLGKYGDEGNKLIFKVLKRGEHEASGEADLALRYDLTVPLARVVAEYQARLPKFFKRYQVQPVWRADRPARGRFREFYQCDIDAIGSKSPVVEAELCAAASEVLTTLGFEDFEIRLNHRQALTALLTAAGVPEQEHANAIVAIDKLEKIGWDGVVRELESRGLAGSRVQELQQVFGVGKPRGGRTALDVHNADMLGPALRPFLGADTEPLWLRNLRDIVDLCRSTPAAESVRIDLSLARGLSYYTGAIMEIVVPQLAGSVAGGGRYDNLVGMFLGREVPACGISLGLERILVVMGERDMFPATVTRAGTDVLVTAWNDQSFADALALAAEIRAGGFRASVYPDADKVGKQIKYAADQAVRFAAIVGDDERARGEVSIKDLSRGMQETVARSAVLEYLKSRLGSD